jgi:hypothetical protein
VVETFSKLEGRTATMFGAEPGNFEHLAKVSSSLEMTISESKLDSFSWRLLDVSCH